MKRILVLLCVLGSLLTLQAQEVAMQFMGVQIGKDKMSVVDQKLEQLGYTDKRYDPTYDVYAYRGTYQGRESCVYTSMMDNIVMRLVFRVSDTSWERLQPLAVTLVKGLKKDYADFKAKENDHEISDLKYRLELKKSLDRIVFFNLQRDNGVFDTTVTYE